jgi:Amt family ammonium transporter
MQSLSIGLSPMQADPVVTLGGQLNLLWVIIGAVLVIFMQAGFALVETGFCRAKNAAHVVSTNFAIFGLGFIAFFLYMVAFMDTTATIPTGAMAERWKWGSFVIWGFFCGAIYYPLFAAWTWGGGWLAKTWDTMSLGAGYVDFAGSGVVHTVGGVAGLAGAIVLGPRIGKFGADGKPRGLPGHHIPMALLGTFILLFGWFGFNAASTFAATDVQFAVVAANTAIAAAFGAITAMLWIIKRTGKPDPGMMANGMLAGLVAITAPCAFVSPAMAAVIGVIAGVLVIEAVFFIERKLKVDDPVGAIAVHGVCGSFGVLAVGLFANGSYGAAWNGSDVKGVEGLFWGDAGQFGAQLLGVVVLWTVIFGVAYAFFKTQDTISKSRGKGGIRSKEADEIAGLDLPEMGVLAYPEFVSQN